MYHISYFGVYTSELVVDKAAYIMIIEYFYSHKSSRLFLITRRATVAAMAESVSIWSMCTKKPTLCGECIYPLTYYLPRRRRPGTGDIATPPVCLSVRPSVRPSVCLSVTFSFRTVTRKRIDAFSRKFAGTCTKSWGCAV